jgi:hypothetical protein
MDQVYFSLSGCLAESPFIPSQYVGCNFISVKGLRQRDVDWDLPILENRFFSSPLLQFTQGFLMLPLKYIGQSSLPQWPTLGDGKEPLVKDL